jgi:hypothetical protein
MCGANNDDVARPDSTFPNAPPPIGISDIYLAIL